MLSFKHFLEEATKRQVKKLSPFKFFNADDGGEAANVKVDPSSKRPVDSPVVGSRAF